MALLPGDVSLLTYFTIRTAASVNLPAEFTIRTAASASLPAEFLLSQLNAISDLHAEFIVRQSASIPLKAEFIVRHSASAPLKAEFLLSQLNAISDLSAEFFVHKTYDLTGALGIGFYWWGSGVVEGDQNIEFQLLSPTGGWIAHFADGDPEWKWVLLPFEDRDPTSLQRLIEVDLGGSKADKSQIEAFLWTYFSPGVRRVAYLCIWYGGDLRAEFTVRASIASDLKTEFTVRQSSFQDLQAEFIVTRPGTADLHAEFIVNP